MPPKRKAALQNPFVGSKKKSSRQSPSATVQPPSSTDQTPPTTEVVVSSVETQSVQEETRHHDGDQEVSMPFSQLQNLIKEAFEAGLKEARSNLPTNDVLPGNLTSSNTSGQLPETTVHASTGHAIGEGLVAATNLLFAPGVTDAAPQTEQFVSQSVPLHLMVTETVRQKILANKFVDMATLTDKDIDGHMTMVVKTSDDQPSLQLVKKSAQTKTLSIDEWTNKCNIFISVFCSVEQNKEAFPGLLKYLSLVRNLANKHADWRYYDKNFRILMANPACSLRWDECQLKLWHEALTRRASSTAHAQTPNICHRFARGEHCSGCRYYINAGFVVQSTQVQLVLYWVLLIILIAIHKPFGHRIFGFVEHAMVPDKTSTTSNPAVTCAEIAGASVNEIVTPVNPVVLAKALQGYDPEKASFLINGFTFGFEFHFNGTASSKTCKNLISAKEMPEVNQKLDKEIKAGRIAGPFVKPPFDSIQVSPLGIVPKKRSQ